MIVSYGIFKKLIGKKKMRVRSWTSPSGPGPQGQYISGPDMEGQGQVHKKSPGPGPDQTSDSLV